MPDHIHGILWLKPNNKLINDGNNGGNICRRGVQLNAPTTNNSSLTHNSTSQSVKSRNQYYSKNSPQKNTLSVVIRTYKGIVKKWCNENRYPQFRWQRNYYEHIIQNEQELHKIRKYIQDNPLHKLYKKQINN